MSQKLTEDEIAAQLEVLPGWAIRSEMLEKRFETGEWRNTLLLAGAIAFLAERAGHHPDLLLTYRAVTVRVTTHDAGGLTQRDFALARRIERLLADEQTGQ